MNTNQGKTPPGWYPDPAGRPRYWDGRAWLDLPPPVSTGAPRSAYGMPGPPPNSPDPKKPRRMSTTAVVGLILGVLVVVVAVIGAVIAGGSAVGTGDSSR